SGGVSGSVLGTQPVVTVQDATSGTVTGDNSTVGLTLVAVNGSVGSLTCSGAQASGGVATFSGCYVTGSGTLKLQATDGSLTADTSAQFTITPPPLPPAKVALTTQPGNGVTGSALAPQPVVTVQDTNGVTVTTDTSTVTLTLNVLTGSGSLTCAMPA